MKISKYVDIVKLLLVRTALKALWIIPIKKNTVFFSAYEGKQYSCNPRAIFEAMVEAPAFVDTKWIWELNDLTKEKLIAKKPVKIVRHNSFQYILAVLTSEVLITNSGISGTLPLRRCQLNINTWHGGGAYKRVGFGIKTELKSDSFWLKQTSKQTSIYLSSSKMFTNVMTESVLLPANRFFPSGMPRNDVFFCSERMSDARNKVLEAFCLADEDFVVLYAPTYRGAVGTDQLTSIPFDIDKFQKAIKCRFGREAVVLVRMHYFNHSNLTFEKVVSASNYPDMQELLSAADMLITDYSSSIWDFALTQKPCILFTPDLKDYDIERGFYTDPVTWPGMLCETEEAMYAAISMYQEEQYCERVTEYLRKMGSYDDGKATKRVIEYIKKAKEENERE